VENLQSNQGIALKSKDKIKQNIEVELWKGRGSESALDILIEALGLTSDGIRHFRGRKSTEATDFFDG
jgi:hypothetical protein